MTLEEVVREELRKRGIHGFTLPEATRAVVKEVGRLCDEQVQKKNQERLERCWAYEHMLPLD